MLLALQHVRLQLARVVRQHHPQQVRRHCWWFCMSKQVCNTRGTTLFASWLETCSTAAEESQVVASPYSR
jgi:hypothetical protein